MSFGYGIGDAFAILNLVERVALEVRNYRDAPRHFQQLAGDLHLLQTTLQRLLQTEPDDEQARERLEFTRAIAFHCSRPLQAFMTKMRPSESALGHVRSAGTLSTFGKRLHWSLVTRGDVDELRAALVPQMMAINVLVGMEQALVKLDTLLASQLIER